MISIHEVTDRNPALLARLVEVWASSVLATHDFLAQSDFTVLKREMPSYLTAVPVLLTAEENGSPVAFMGLAGAECAMLFVAAESRGRGIGRALLEEAVRHRNVTRVTVNEQNTQAVGFYEHMGFHVTERSPLDAQGRPYPILTMRLSG
ncbi:MAG: acetyltransferase [Desulfovibrionaceae bacterium]|nr:acetyltransferase [Desulfovibrionaceae bacterium]